MINKKLSIIIGVAAALCIAVVVGVWFFWPREASKNNAPLTYTAFTSDEGFAADYPNWKKLDITNPAEGMPIDLAARENLKILLYVTNGAAVVQISERIFPPKSSFKDNVAFMIKNQRESVKDLLIWRYEVGGATSLLESTSDLNGVKMHTLSKAFDVGRGKIYSVAFITADNNYKMFKEIADHVIYSAKVWR